MLQAWGIGAKLRGEAEFVLTPKQVEVGGAVQLAVTLRSTVGLPQRLAIDYVVHHVKSNGGTSPKVRKGWLIELGPYEQRVSGI